MKTSNDETEHAIAAFTGLVKRCPPGKARGGKPIKKVPGPDLNAAGWKVPPPDESEQRRQRRIASAKRARIAKRNAKNRCAGTKRKNKAGVTGGQRRARCTENLRGANAVT
jgi:hypothetical protein